MRILSNTPPVTPQRLEKPAQANEPGQPEPKETVTFDKSQNAYVYTKGDYVRVDKKVSVLKEALTGAALAGLPGAFGLFEGNLLGAATAGIQNQSGHLLANGVLGLAVVGKNAGLGALIGVGVGGVKGYQEATEGKPKTEGFDVGGLPRAGLYGFFGGIGGAIGGALLPLSGLIGGVPGVAVATCAFAGFGAYSAIKNNKQKLDAAIAHGYQA